MVSARTKHGAAASTQSVEDARGAPLAEHGTELAPRAERASGERGNSVAMHDTNELVWATTRAHTAGATAALASPKVPVGGEVADVIQVGISTKCGHTSQGLPRSLATLRTSTAASITVSDSRSSFDAVTR